MTDLEPQSLIVGVIFGAVLVLVVLAIVVGAKPDPEQQDDAL